MSEKTTGEKPKEKIVWGACDNNGSSYLYGYCPYRERTGGWMCDEPDGDLMKLESNDLFPSDQPQKYKLVPVDE